MIVETVDLLLESHAISYRNSELLRVIQQLRGQKFAIFFTLPPPPAWTVLILCRGQKQIFLTPSPIILST